MNFRLTLVRRLTRSESFIAALLLGPAALLVQAQQPEQTALSSLTPGLRVSSVTLYSSYYSPNPFVNTGGYDISWGGSATLAWSRTRPRSSFSGAYTPSYLRDSTNSDLSSLNHAFSFSSRYNLSPNWELTAGASTEVMNQTGFLFRSNSASQLAETASTPDQLATAILTGASPGNARLAALLTGAPLLEGPGRQVLFGNRLLDASFQTGLSYRRSRTAVSFSGSGSRAQTLSTTGTTAATSVVPAVTSVEAGVNVSYSYSPRTQVGVSTSVGRAVSRFVDTYTTGATGSFGRKMSERWFLEFHGGLGVFTPRRSLYVLPGSAQYLAGGRLGFKTFSHTLLLSTDRSISDAYGFGATSTLSTTASWTWSRPNRGWKVFASGSQQQLRGSGFQDVNAWVATVGFTEKLRGNTAFNITYAEMRNTGQPTARTGDLSTHAVRVTLIWNP